MTQQQTVRLRRTAQPAQKRGILSQLSLPAIVAASLTALTSFLLSSRLGLTGSLIGAGISAAVSTTASQIYNAMISRSVDRLHDLSDQVATMVETGHPAHPELDRTQVRRMPVDLHELEATAMLPITGTPVAPVSLRAEANRRRNTARMRKSFAVTLAFGLASLMAYAVIITMVTRGQGIGPSDAYVWEVAAEQDEQQVEAEAEDQEKTPAEDEEVDQEQDDSQGSSAQDTPVVKPAEPEDDTASEEPAEAPSDGGSLLAPKPEQSEQTEEPAAPAEEAPADTSDGSQEEPAETTDSSAASPAETPAA